MCDSCGCGNVHEHDHGDDDQRARQIEVRTSVLAHNDEHAQANRARFAHLSMASINLIGSPGAGKTTLLEASLSLVSPARKVLVIEGDLQTARDADRIARAGGTAHQINTGEGCHLDAHMVGHGLDHLPLEEGALVVIENVGNLVCPASFDLGEGHKVVVLSVAEGDDKVEKYPVAFRGASAVVLSKTDLLEHVDFDVARCREMLTVLCPEAKVFEVSARTGAGMEPLAQWLREL